MMASDPITALERARARLDAGRLRAAARCLPPASRVAPPLRPERDFLEAEALRGQGYFKRAEALYRRVLERPAAEDPALWIEAALGSAAGLRSLGAVGRGRALLARARAAARRLGLVVLVRRLDLEEALLDRAAGRYPRAISKLSTLLRAAERRPSLDEAAFLYWALGGALRFSGRLTASERVFRRSLALARRTADKVGQGYARFGLGGVTRIRGKLAESAGQYAEAGRAFEGTEDLFGRAYALCGLANALRQQGKLAQAERLYRLSRKLYSSLGDEVDLAYVDWGLGKIRLRRGDLRGAERKLRSAERGFSRHRETRGVVLARQALAQAIHAGGRTAAAERLFESAVGLSRRAGLHAHLETFT